MSRSNIDLPQFNDTAADVLKRVVHQKLYDLTDVVAVITGGSTGIGLHLSTTLLANGAKTVYLVGLEQQQLDAIASKYTEAAKELGLPGKMIGVQGVIGTKAEALRIAKVIGDMEGPDGYVTFLANNAGAIGECIVGDLLQFKTPAEKQAAMLDFGGEGKFGFTGLNDIHVAGPYYMSVAFIQLLAKSNEHPTLKDRVSASVSITASCSADGNDVRLAGHSYPYLFSKRAAMHLVSALARDFLPLGIRVNGINPGWFVTNIGRPLEQVDALGRTPRLDSFEAPPTDYNAEIDPPNGRGGRPQEMGMLALYLVCCGYLTGRVITMDGGLMLLHA